jgi:hypothetical protein
MVVGSSGRDVRFEVAVFVAERLVDHLVEVGVYGVKAITGPELQSDKL